MLNKIIQFSIKNKLVIGLFTLALIIWGVYSAKKLPIDAVPDIRFLLDDQDIWVRYHTIVTFGDLEQGDLVEYILPYLDDDMDIIKIAAIKTLSRLEAGDVVPRLEAMRKEKNPDVAAAAELALSSIGEKR